MTPVEILKGARELLSDPAKWTQGQYAKDKDGNPCFPSEEEAVCFCSVGALQKMVNAQPMFQPGFAAMPGPGHNLDFDHARRCLRNAMGTRIADYNDAPHRTHEEILKAFDEAILRAQ